MAETSQPRIEHESALGVQLHKVENPLGVIWGYPPIVIDPNDPPDFSSLGLRLRSEFKGRESHGLIQSEEHEEYASVLSEATNAVAVDDFINDCAWAAKPGLYAWHADEAASELLGKLLGVLALPTLLYVGQAGATSKNGKESEATLRSRITKEHIKGQRRSTLRKTLACVLRDDLDLTIESDGTCKGPSRERLSAWMQQHLRVIALVRHDRATLKALEEHVVQSLDPQFNLEHCEVSDVRVRLRQLRTSL